MHPLAPPPDDREPFLAEVRTRWSDEDLQGVLNNAVYPTLFEEARHAWCSELGLLSENEFPFVLAQQNVRFLRPGRGGEAVRVELWTLRLGNKSFEQAYRVRAEADGEIWAEGEALLVAWDGATRSSCPLSGDFRGRVARREGIPEGPG